MKPASTRAAVGERAWYYIARFALILFALFAAEMTLFAQRLLVEPWTGLLALASAVVARTVFPRTTAEGITLADPESGFAISIVAGCNGVEAVIILSAAMFAFRTTWKHRVVGLLGGFLAVQVANVGRIVSLFALGQWNREVFEVAHLYLWQVLIMLDVLIVWMLWLRYLPNRAGADA